MCGIAGSVNFRLNVPLLIRDLYHRGPDEQQIFEENNVQLHHHRLSIVDVSGGHQPMHDDYLTIVFNGEIYNHTELRKKYSFQCRTASDTETILKAYKLLGPSCLNEFDGMFAFVILDRCKNELFIARDRAGKKPFYYYLHKNQFVFASELNALYHQVRPEVCERSIAQYIQYGAFHNNDTPYNNVSELLPGHYVCVSLNHPVIKPVKWWSVRSYYEEKKIDSFREALTLTDEALHSAIKRRLESSDLEVGSFLSGGIDSGLVTAIASHYKPSLKTYTVSFNGVYDEAPLARLVAEQFKTEHTEINISFDKLLGDIEKILANYGEPFYDDSAIPSYYVSREAKKHLTVILNGDGSDELFGGYRRYVPYSRYDFFSKPGAITAMAKAIKKVIPFSNEKQSKLNYLYRLADLASQEGIKVYLSSTTDIFTGFESQLCFNVENPLAGMESLLTETKRLSLTGMEKMMYMDFNAILPDILLVKMDIATMANSLEGRSPFLSKEILELAPRIKNGHKIKGTTTKFILRRLAEKYLPAELINQPKRGFEIPLKQWVNNELKEIISDYLLSPGSYANNYIQKEFVHKLLDGKIDVHEEKRAKMLYTLFALNVWHKKCVRSE